MGAKVYRQTDQTVRVKLENRSKGDVDRGWWMIVLPVGVSFHSSSIPLTQSPYAANVYILNPVKIQFRDSLTFFVKVQIGRDAPDRVTLRSFLTDEDNYCESVSSFTVSVAAKEIPPSPNTTIETPFLLLLATRSFLSTAVVESEASMRWQRPCRRQKRTTCARREIL